jgi:hypothetical protein
MSAKLARIAMTSLMLVLPGPVCGALAASTEADQRILEAKEKFPANSFVVLEAKLFEGGKTTEVLCSSMNVIVRSDEGKNLSIMTRDLFLFDKANNKFGGGALIPPGGYTVVEIMCGSHHYRGSFARFTLQPAQSVNLGCLIVEFRSSPFKLLAYPTYSGHSRVADLSPIAVESLTRRMPVSFGQAVKRYMTPVLTGQSGKHAANSS